MEIITKNKKLLVNNKTLIMGILNLTPDSFSGDGILYYDTSHAVNEAKRMSIQGADIIDIGGESIKKGADKISEEEELKRILPVIIAIRKELGNSILISVDTYKSRVAHEAITAGADLINDVSGLQMDNQMANVAHSTKAAIIVTHMRNRLGIKNPTGDPVSSSILFFKDQIKKLTSLGVSRKSIILDPGFGFGKTTRENINIIKKIHLFTQLKFPILLAASRKKTFGKMLQNEFNSFAEYDTSERLSATLAATAYAVMGGVRIIRTHDIYETKNFITILDKLRSR